MTKQFGKTYIKTIAKYKQVPPMLNFLYGSFSTVWVIYLTAKFQQKNVMSYKEPVIIYVGGGGGLF